MAAKNGKILRTIVQFLQEFQSITAFSLIQPGSRIAHRAASRTATECSTFAQNMQDFCAKHAGLSGKTCRAFLRNEQLHFQTSLRLSTSQSGCFGKTEVNFLSSPCDPAESTRATTRNPLRTSLRREGKAMKLVSTISK